METINYKLEKFEGPLDLCLTLIKNNKMSIDDIQISVLCDQYMEYIVTAGNMNIELSSEFLLMASELMLIKSKMLLPRQNENEEDPRANLAAAILEYQRAKEASVILKDSFDKYGKRFIKDTDEISIDKSYVKDHDFELLSIALLKVMNEVHVSDDEAKSNFTPLIEKKSISISVVVKRIVNKFQAEKKSSVLSVFKSAESKSELVTMFLAMLELLKAGALILEENSETDDNGVLDTNSDFIILYNDDADVSNLESIMED